MMRLHKPVLLERAVQLLNCRDGGLYVDCTLGMGGHAERILQACAPTGFLAGIDRDQEAIEFCKKKLDACRDRVAIIQGDYRMLNAILQEHHIELPSGILADLGASLLQFTTPERGFSFMLSGPLDMRMDRTQELTAEQIINLAGAAELTRILRTYGEEKASARIASRIVQERKRQPIRTTEQLRKLVEEVVPRRRDQKIHPATRTFQALRIAVNRELEGLDTFLFEAFDALANEGRLVLIAFHSLEDRIVKQVFQFLSAACRCPKRYVQCQCSGRPLSRRLTKSPAISDSNEITKNPASRSAKLRAIEKIGGPAPRSMWNEWLKER